MQWEKRTALITDNKGNTIFEQKDVEVPIGLVDDGDQYCGFEVPAWSDRNTGARNGCAAVGGRVAETIRDWGIAGGYFASAQEAAVFHDELAVMLLTQRVAFNSPVWFNVGCDRLEPDADGQNWHWDAPSGGVVFSRHGLSESAVLRLLHQCGG